MGIFDSTATKAGAPITSSDSTANNNAYAGAPVLNFTDSRAASGKYVEQDANQLNFNIQSTDYGAIGDAFDYALRVGDNAASLAYDGLSKSSSVAMRGLDNAANLAYDGVNKSLNFAAQVASDNTAFAGRILDKQTVANLEFLGEVSNFADLSRQTAKEQAAFSERQANAAINAITGVQSSALDQVARFGQDAQNASMKALDYVFESTKSETARLSEISMKWIVVAAVAVFIAPFLLKVK